MPADCYYSPEIFHQSQKIILEGTEAHHLINVMRKRADDFVTVVNGQGQLAIARIEENEKRRALLTIVEIKSEEAVQQKLILAQGLPKMNRLETILEKATELGMAEIWLFPCQGSEKQDLTPNQKERMQGILVSAMKQCGRLYLPKIEILSPLKKWNSLPYSAYFGDLRTSAEAFWTLLVEKTKRSMIFFIGPESGFSEEEIGYLERLGAKGLKLHQNILRTDTAAITACYLMSQQQQEGCSY